MGIGNVHAFENKYTLEAANLSGTIIVDRYTINKIFLSLNFLILQRHMLP